MRGGCLDDDAVSLDDQTQVDSKPAGQPEHASLNQCQLIAANRPLWAPPAGGGDKYYWHESSMLL